MATGERVLVIEDNPAVMEGVAIWLDTLDCEVLRAETGREGVEQARKYLPDLIICDYAMPDFDGLDVLETVKNSSRTVGIPFMMFSAFLTPSLKYKCQQMGANACVSKSAGVEELIEAINRLLHE